jgi:hypothetical protein
MAADRVRRREGALRPAEEDSPMRKFPRRLTLAMAACCLVAIAVAVVPAIGADDASPEPIAAAKNIMNALNHERDGFYGMIRAFCTASDQTDEGWKMARHRAVMMAEGGNLLMGMTPPKGGDDAAGMKAWRVQCAQFRDACKELSKALALKKTDKVTAALDAVNARCEACHTAHRN